MTDLGIPADYAVRRRMALHVEATELVSAVAASDGRTIRLKPTAAVAWKRMRDAASGEGISLEALSGFRSVERQEEIIRAKLAAGETIEAILQTVAAPGYSEHHTGRAIDIGIPGDPPLTEAFAASAAFRWLMDHAHDFGFSLSYPKGNVHGIAFEPWHWYFEEPATWML
jgi:D-alanyl-D-alanine carboxypeptidase